MQSLDSLRDEIARITRRGIGMPAAGLAFWLAAALVGQHYSPRSAALIWFFATGAVFPIGWALTRWAGGDLMAKGHPLTGLGGLLNAVQLFYWPILIAMHFARPEWVPFTMATLFCSHFLPYGWFYRSRGYTVLGIGAPALALGLQLAAPTHAWVAIPLGMAAMHALAVAMLLAENRRDMRALASTAQSA